MHTSSENVLAQLGVTTKTSAQVETNVIKSIEEASKQQINKEIRDLTDEINAFEKELQNEYNEDLVETIRKNFQMGKIKKIKDDQAVEILRKIRHINNLKKKRNSLKSVEIDLVGDLVGEKRPGSSLPGNVAKKAKHVETERERLIREGKITPFSNMEGLERNYVNLTTSLDARPSVQPARKAIRSNAFQARPDPNNQANSLIIKKRSRKPLPKPANVDTSSSSNGNATNREPIKLIRNPKRRRRTSNVENEEEEQEADKVRNGNTNNNKSLFTYSESDVVLSDGYRIPGEIFNNLFEHQKTSVKWLWELYCTETGGIIADEMGLGKTIQAVCFCAGLHYSGMIDRPILVLCPNTVMEQWSEEFEKWWPHLFTRIYHRSSQGDMAIKKFLNQMRSKKGVIITSYGTLMANPEFLKIEYEMAFLDEGHKIKSPDAKITQACKQIQTRNRIILTGAPIQNSLVELWSLFDFIFPGKLGTLPVFRSSFEEPITAGSCASASTANVQAAYKCAVVLRDVINPYLLRRMKADVNINLPEKHEQVLYCPLTELQKSEYRRHLSSDIVNKARLGKVNHLAAITSLGKICNHPDILFEQPPKSMQDYGNPARSGKMIVLKNILPLWLQEGHRALLFTRTVRMLDILAAFADEMGFTYLRMDGKTGVNKRADLIRTYQEDQSIFLFLLTTKTGGVGINLTSADRVILYDPDWNPSTDIQARERAWRIGQLKNVTIFRLITSGTIEEKIFQRQIYKQFLSNRILKDPRQKRFLHSHVLSDLFSFDESGPQIEETEIEADENNQSYYQARNELDSHFDNRHNHHHSASAPVKARRVSRRDRSPSPEAFTMKESEKEKKFEKEKNELQMEKQKSNQIIAAILASTGVQGVSHDELLPPNMEIETFIMNEESDKIASRALQQMEQSAAQCIQNEVNIPTWTGKKGEAGGPSQPAPRFGTKKNSKIASPFGVAKPTTSGSAASLAYSNIGASPVRPAPVTWVSLDLYPDGTPINNNTAVSSGTPSATPTNATPVKNNPSTSILDRLRNINSDSGSTLSPSPLVALMTANAAEGKPEVSENTKTDHFQHEKALENAASSQAVLARMAHNKNPVNDKVINAEDTRSAEILADLRKAFVDNDGKIGTDEIVELFKDKLPTQQDLHVFRSILRQIAFTRQGAWSLKQKYVEQFLPN